MYNPKLSPDSWLSANSPQLHKTKSGPTITTKNRLIKSLCKNYAIINPLRLNDAVVLYFTMRLSCCRAYLA